MLAARRLNTTQLPSDREVEAYIATIPDVRQSRDLGSGSGSVSHAEDPSIAAEIEKTNSIDQIIAVLQSHKIEFKRQKNRLDTAIVPTELYSQACALPPGEPFLVPVGDRSVASAVASKEPNPLTGDQAKPAAVR